MFKIGGYMDELVENLKIFIKGECCDLCIPDEDLAYESDWFDIFNSSENTEFLFQGVYPNTREMQRDFFNNASKNGRLILIIKSSGRMQGVISLSNIDLSRKSAGLAMVLDRRVFHREKYLIGLEAICLIVKHAFEEIGIERINSGHPVDLVNWHSRKELIGFRYEGLSRSSFIKGMHVKDGLISSIILSDYIFLKKIRGDLWDGKIKMNNRIKKMKTIGKDAHSSFYLKYLEFYKKEYDNHYYSLWED